MKQIRITGFSEYALHLADDALLIANAEKLFGHGKYTLNGNGTAVIGFVDGYPTLIEKGTLNDMKIKLAACDRLSLLWRDRVAEKLFGQSICEDLRFWFAYDEKIQMAVTALDGCIALSFFKSNNQQSNG